jgi:hypothetical protein
MDTATEKQHAHELIERLEPEDTRVAVRFLEFMLLDPVSRSIASAPVEDEEISEQEERAVAEAKEWLKHNKPIPHHKVLAEFGLTEADFEKMGQKRAANRR